MTEPNTPTGETKPLLLCLKGAQGSGKGEQAKLFVRTLRARGFTPRVLTMSELLQETGDAQVRALMDKGKPVPCGLLKGPFETAMDAALREGCDAIVADGYPRYTAAQVDDFVDLAQGFKCQTCVVRIRADRELCVRRITQRAQEMKAAGKNPRPDDLDPAAVNNRLELYFRTRPFVSRRLLHRHRLPHFTVTAKDELTAAQLHGKLVAQMWPDQGSARSDDWMLVGAGGRPIAVA